MNAATTEAPQPTKRRQRAAAKVWRWLGRFAGIALICAFFSTYPASRDSFLTWENWRVIAAQSVIVGMAALGMTLIMIAGGIDLSVGSVVALVTVAVAQSIRQYGFNVPMALAAGVMLGVLCGSINGLLITGMRVVPFIVTLGTLKIYRGLAKLWAGYLSIYAFDAKHPEPAWLKRTLAINLEPPAGLRNIPGPIGTMLREVSRVAPGFWILLALSALVAALLRYSLLGRYLYAVGSNESAARLCGIRVNLVKVAVYALGGAAVGLAGVMQFAYNHGTGDPTTSEGLELQVIAAVVIGGGSLLGGEGTILGTLIGCVIIQVLDNGCTIAVFPDAVQDLIIGAIIIVAVALDGLRRNPGMWRAWIRGRNASRDTP